MAIEVFDLQSGSVSAEQYRRAFSDILGRNASQAIGTGAGGILYGDLAVSAPASGLSVNVAPGVCYVPGSASFATTPGLYYFRNSSNPQNVTGFTSNATNPTIYAVVATINDAAYHGVTNSGVIQAVSGTPTSGATLTNLTGAPAIPDASLLLAWVLVPANVTNIVTADILNASAVAWNSTVDQFPNATALNVALGIPTCGIIRDSSGSNKTLKPFQHYIVSSGSPTYTLPVPFPGATVIVTNYGSGTVTLSHNASEVIYGLGMTSSGQTAFSLGTVGATATVESDGTNWYVTAGQQDTGWLALSSYGNSWSNSANASARKVGNTVYLRGTITGGSSGTAFANMPTGSNTNFYPVALLAMCVINQAGGQNQCTVNVPTSGAMTMYIAGTGSTIELWGVIFQTD